MTTNINTPIAEIFTCSSLMTLWIHAEGYFQSGILSLALALITLQKPKTAFKHLRETKKFAKLNINQKNNLAALAARLGVTRKFLIITDYKITKNIGSLGNKKIPRFTDEDTLGIYGSAWPEHYPAIIQIKNPEILQALDSDSATSAYTTSILHEMAHVKNRDGKRLPRRILACLCTNVASIALGYFAGKRSYVNADLVSGSIFGIGVGLIAGVILGNIVMGISTLKMEQKAEETAVRASTSEELTGHMFRELQCISCEIPYWKLVFQPYYLWRDPPSANLKKMQKIQREKLISEGKWKDKYKDWGLT